MEALRREAQTDDAVAAAVEGERRGGDLNDVRAAVGVEEIGAAELMKERLAVVAVAEEPIHGARGRVRDTSVNLPTATS